MGWYSSSRQADPAPAGLVSAVPGPGIVWETLSDSSAFWGPGLMVFIQLTLEPALGLWLGVVTAVTVVVLVSLPVEGLAQRCRTGRRVDPGAQPAQSTAQTRSTGFPGAAPGSYS